jgi:predicted metal-binding membrane protein
MRAKDSLPFECLLRHDRAITLLLLAAIISFAAWGLLAGGHSLMPAPDAWAGGAAALFLMWWMMMVAMMLPSAAPAILTFAAINARLSRPSAAPWHPAAFITGYLAVWTGFSLLAVAAHLAFVRLEVMPDLMVLSSPLIGGALLTAAGIWQLTPLKHACLRHCQSPFLYLARNWRSGAAGALRTGFRHGLYCLGCCWVLMALLFYGGTMSLAWIGGLAFYVLLEKTLPRRYRLEKLAGIFLIVWGALTLAGWLTRTP